ncbi:MAG TPA: acyl carrier protein [Steroidobacteraceae bacterium]|jgi:acyl carrier protein
MSDKLDRIKQIISTLFNVDAASLTLASSPKDIPGWDSMGQLMLILELEQQFDIQIPPERAEKLSSISQIVDYVEEST